MELGARPSQGLCVNAVCLQMASSPALCSSSAKKTRSEEEKQAYSG